MPRLQPIAWSVQSSISAMAELNHRMPLTWRRRWWGTRTGIIKTKRKSNVIRATQWPSLPIYCLVFRVGIYLNSFLSESCNVFWCSLRSRVGFCKYHFLFISILTTHRSGAWWSQINKIYAYSCAWAPRNWTNYSVKRNVHFYSFVFRFRIFQLAVLLYGPDESIDWTAIASKHFVNNWTRMGRWNQRCRLI